MEGRFLPIGIQDFEKKTRFYTLDFPNREIEDGFLNVVLKKFVKKKIKNCLRLVWFILHKPRKCLVGK